MRNVHGYSGTKDFDIEFLCEDLAFLLGKTYSGRWFSSREVDQDWKEMRYAAILEAMDKKWTHAVKKLI